MIHAVLDTKYLAITMDNRRAYAVCRFLASGTFLIITAYVEEKR